MNISPRRPTGGLTYSQALQKNRYCKKCRKPVSHKHTTECLEYTLQVQRTWKGR